MKKIALIALSMLFIAHGAFAAEVTLAWDQNSPTPTGYALFERSSANGGQYDYLKPVWPTDGQDYTTTVATVTVADDQEHFFVVRAYQRYTAADGSTQVVWSGDSNEVSFVATPQSPQNLIIQAINQIIQSLNTIKNAIGAGN